MIRLKEYDFSKGERGKFYRKGAKLHLPLYLDEKVLSYLQQRATAKGVDVNRMVNDILKRDIELVEALK